MLSINNISSQIEVLLIFPKYLSKIRETVFSGTCQEANALLSPLILRGTGVQFTQIYAFSHKKRLNYALSYDFDIFKGMSHNLELSNFQKTCGLLGFIRKIKAARTVMKCG